MSKAAGGVIAAVQVRDAGLTYGAQQALDGIDLTIPVGSMTGVIGPDGVGKSSLLALVAGARIIQRGSVQVLGGDMADRRHRERACPHIAYMPQGLGRNLYPTLSVEENLQFFGRLFGHGSAERRRRIDELTDATGLRDFLARPAGKLSGGMKQKLGLCCALIHDPQLLILDEPTTGVDPLARAQFWQLIGRIRATSPAMTVIVATAYMDEAATFEHLVAMDAGRLLATGTPAQLLAQTGTDDLDAAFIALLPPERRDGHRTVTIPPWQDSDADAIAIEAQDLTMRFGDFVAVDHVSFRIRRGEIFGFLGSNGCGKTTTMKMLTGLLPASEGRAWLFGREVDPHDLATRQRVGYMSQSFSLYSELTVEQNLTLHARLFAVPAAKIAARVDAMVARFGLEAERGELPSQLPLGMRQRLSLAVALVHDPELLILDEPTSGVDPVARDAFWQLLVDLSRNDKVTIFISTHFMNEAARCDRISLMHAGRVLVSDTPAALVRQRGAGSLEEAFIGWLVEAGAGQAERAQSTPPAPSSAIQGGAADPSSLGATPIPTADEIPSSTAVAGAASAARRSRPARFDWRRAWSYSRREALELQRDPVRSVLALLGSVILLFVMGYGISMDVEDLTYAVLDLDQTQLSQSYGLNLAGSRYFIERPALTGYDDIDRRMRRGEIGLAIEIPSGFARDLQRGRPVEIGAWVDGSMPSRAETIRGYVLGMHQSWLQQLAEQEYGRRAAALAGPAQVETRFRYNPDVKSLPAMVPAVIPILLLMLPAMLTALSVVREKEMGSIINLYVTPVRRLEFLLGKQLPYVAISMLNFLLLVLLAVTLFGVPLTGSFATLLLAAFIFSVAATGLGMVASAVTRSQIAAMFFTIVATTLPAVQFAGLLHPVSSLEGPGRLIGEVYPISHFLTISRGVFSKELGFGDLHQAFWAMAVAVPVILGFAVALLKKQER